MTSFWFIFSTGAMYVAHERNLAAVAAAQCNQSLAQLLVDDLGVVQDLELLHDGIAAAILVLEHLVVVRAEGHLRVLPGESLVVGQSLAEGHPINLHRIDLCTAELLEVILQGPVHLVFGVPLLERSDLHSLHLVLVGCLDELLACPSIFPRRGGRARSHDCEGVRPKWAAVS